MQEPRQVAAVRNPAVRMKCDHQTDKAWLRGWEQRTNASTADFCDTGGAAELAVKALFPRMQGWAQTLQVCPSHHPCIPQSPKICLHHDTIPAVIAGLVGVNLSDLIQRTSVRLLLAKRLPTQDLRHGATQDCMCLKQGKTYV